MSKKKSLEEFVEMLNKNDFNTIDIIGEFDGMKKKVEVRCKVCGYEWNAMPQHLVRGSRCKKCRNSEKIGKVPQKWDTDKINEEFNKKNMHIVMTSEYVTMKTDSDFKCLKCGNIWKSKPFNMLGSIYGCPLCAKEHISSKQLKDADTFIEELEEVNDSVKIVGRYQGNHSYVLCRCNRCGREWNGTPSNLLRGEACPFCNRSHGEKFISKWLSKNGVEFEEQKCFIDLVGDKGRNLSYDFYIPSYNLLIEFQGQSHDGTDRRQSDEEYAIRIKYDNKKKKFADDNSINFLEIWYYDDADYKLTEWFSLHSKQIP